MGVVENLIIAMKRIPVWMIGMTAFYAPLRAFQQGVRDIIEINTQLTNLRKVIDATNEDFKNFAVTASEVGIALGKTAQEVIQVSVEFGRLGYDLKQSAVLAHESLLLANVGVMTIEESTKALIATVKGFGVTVDEQGNNVRKVVDMVNEVGKNINCPLHWQQCKRTKNMLENPY